MRVREVEGSADGEGEGRAKAWGGRASGDGLGVVGYRVRVSSPPSFSSVYSFCLSDLVQP